jgi:hypothetical protein
MAISDEAAPVSAPSPREQPATAEPRGEAVGEPEAAELSSGVVDSDGSARPQGGASGDQEGDDVIRDQREVFEMARERFGSRGPDGGS